MNHHLKETQRSRGLSFLRRFFADRGKKMMQGKIIRNSGGMDGLALQGQLIQQQKRRQGILEQMMVS